ncbi:MAG: hypothetical protein A3F17_02900 [Gammaproteobacteria bacterium RIFCSPHIGHO2_12_FULL_41_15]|nr:MAG: hypothetical protein A3F17_02900 [Gammaproteobacteria bacterium RIFCSPHIGHO2_12_FULL_41_15]
MANARWSSRLTFIMASAGAAVGLGNIWRFPYITGQSGGAAFVVVYIICMLVLGIPLIMAETIVGRHARRNPADAYGQIALENKRSSLWQGIGLLGILASFLVLSYYVVISGWVLDYVYHSILSEFQPTPLITSAQAFDKYLANPWQMLLSDTIIIGSMIFVVTRGIKEGLEKTIYILFPMLASLLFILLIYALRTGHFIEALSFLFKPDVDKINGKTILVALGQTFFSLNVGFTTIVAYGSYLKDEISIIKTSIIIAVIDTAVSLLSGLVIFPVVFSNHLAPDSGVSLIFKTIPLAFSSMPFGNIFASLFFSMVLIAAFTSVIALLEPLVMLLNERLDWSRKKSAMIAGTCMWLLSFLTIGSFNVIKTFKIFGMTLFENIDFLTSNIMLPIGGLFVALFLGWRVKKTLAFEQLKLTDKSFLFRAWYFTIRYIAPISILLILLSSIGLM